MRTVLVMTMLAGLAAGQTLRVKSADAHSVQLEWTGGAAVVERTTGSATQVLAKAAVSGYEDKAIDRFATYRYRVRIGAKVSNEVVVGPPPGGVTNAAPLPKGVEAGKFGLATAMALDENSDPVIVFEWEDPNGDGDYTDNEVDFVRWNRAAYRWTAAKRIRVVGPIESQNTNPLAIGCDRASGLLEVVTPVAEKGARLEESADGGASWKETAIPGADGTVNCAALAVGGGQSYLVVTSSDAGAHLLRGPSAEPGSWKSEALPVGASWKQPQNVNVAVALDAAGQPVVAWFETQQDGDERRFQVWRPGSGPTTAVVTKREADTVSLALGSGGGRLGLLVATPLDENDDDHGVWFTQSADGVAWSKPSMPPVDGPRGTNAPLAVALTSHGAAVAVFGSNSGSGDTACNYPVLSRSADGSAWKTCGPGKAEGGTFSPQPANLHVVEAENDRAYVLWPETEENKYHEGVLVWHER